MLGVLELALRHHAVAGARLVAPQLQIFLEQLLRRSPDPQIGTGTVEHMVPIERNVSAVMANAGAAATAAAIPTTAAA